MFVRAVLSLIWCESLVKDLSLFPTTTVSNVTPLKLSTAYLRHEVYRNISAWIHQCRQ